MADALYAADGQRQTLSFGTYPRITLIEARQRREEALISIRAGGGERGTAEQRNRSHRSILATFADFGRKWLEVQKARWSEVHFVDFKQTLETHILPQLGNIPIEKVDRAIIQTVLDPLAAAGKHETLKN